MSAPTCTCGCTRPVPDGYAAPACMDRARQQLAEIADLTVAARDVAQRQARRGIGGGAAGKPGSSLPIDLGATARLDAVQNCLTGWVRVIAEERGPAAEINAGASKGVSGWGGMGETGRDDLSGSAQWLGGHCEWMRHKEFVDEFLTDVNAAVRVIRLVADPGRRKGRYAGPCSTEVDGKVCGEDVIARADADTGTCRKCGAEYSVDEQQTWMRSEIEDYLGRPMEIAGVLLRLGFKVGYSTIAAYAAKGQLVAHGQDDKGRPLFRIGDVMSLRMGVKAS